MPGQVLVNQMTNVFGPPLRSLECEDWWEVNAQWRIRVSVYQPDDSGATRVTVFDPRSGADGLAELSVATEKDAKAILDWIKALALS